MGGDRRPDTLEAHALKIPGRLEETPDLYLGEIVARLACEGIATSGSSVSWLLARHGITRKKRL